MKIFILLLMVISSLTAKQYVFMINKYDKEIDLEAKIIYKIASSSMKNRKVRLYIPDITKPQEYIYSQYFTLSDDCESADFVFDTKGIADKKCKKSNKLFFTNNYRRLVSNNRYYGAFFWSKSRPNIVFIRQRLNDNKLQLPEEYSKYIEEEYE